MLIVVLENPELSTYRISDYSSVWGEWGANRMGFVFVYTSEDIPKPFLNRGTRISLYVINKYTRRLHLLRRFFLMNWTYLTRNGKESIAIFGNDIHYILRFRVLVTSKEMLMPAQQMVYAILNASVGFSTGNDPVHPWRKGRYVPEITVFDDGNAWVGFYKGPYVSLMWEGISAWNAIYDILERVNHTLLFFIKETGINSWLAMVDEPPLGKRVVYATTPDKLYTYDQRVKFDQVGTVVLGRVSDVTSPTVSVDYVDPFADGLNRLEVFESWTDISQTDKYYYLAINEVSITDKLSNVPPSVFDIDVGDNIITKDFLGQVQELPVIGFRINYNRDQNRNDISILAGIKGDKGL